MVLWLHADRLCASYSILFAFGLLLDVSKVIPVNGMENTTRNQSLHEASIWSKQGYMIYGIVMASILTIGFVGNVLTLLVLQRNEHRSRSVTPLMINLACAGLFIIVFGYPVAINANLAGGILEEGGHCKWLGFTNGMIGITSIVTLTEIGLVSYHGLKQVNTTQRLSARQVTLLICGAWLYGGVSMLPPLLGWNRFVLTSSKVSCCPDWAAKSASAVTYNLFLVILGFFIPLLAMIGCYYKIYNLVHQNVVPGNVEIQLRQRTSLMKIVRMTAMSVLAFVLSWSPYCVVSLTTVFAGRHVISPGEPDFAAMLAKTSVIYNPIVYTVLNTRFRATLVRILHLPRRKQRCDVAVPRRKSQSLVQEDPIQLETVREIEEPTFMRRNPRT